MMRIIDVKWNELALEVCFERVQNELVYLDVSLCGQPLDPSPVYFEVDVTDKYYFCQADDVFKRRTDQSVAFGQRLFRNGCDGQVLRLENLSDYLYEACLQA